MFGFCRNNSCRQSQTAICAAYIRQNNSYGGSQPGDAGDRFGDDSESGGLISEAFLRDLSWIMHSYGGKGKIWLVRDCEGVHGNKKMRPLAPVRNIGLKFF